MAHQTGPPYLWDVVVAALATCMLCVGLTLIQFRPEGTLVGGLIIGLSMFVGLVTAQDKMVAGHTKLAYRVAVAVLFVMALGVCVLLFAIGAPLGGPVLD